MQRVAFQLRIREEKIEEYEEAHRHVWPELIEELEFCGVSQYSIFRRGQQLFLYMHVPDFQALTEHLRQSDVDKRWQQTMAPLFEPVLDLGKGETIAMMQEIFYMKGCEPKE